MKTTHSDMNLSVRRRAKAEAKGKCGACFSEGFAFEVQTFAEEIRLCLRCMKNLVNQVKPELGRMLGEDTVEK